MVITYCYYLLKMNTIIDKIFHMSQYERTHIQTVLDIIKSIDYSRKICTLPNNFNSELLPGFIPDSVTHLTFGWGFERKLLPGVIPDSVTHITFDKWFILSKKDITVFNTVKEIQIEEFVYKFGTLEFDKRFTVYQKPVKGAID